MNALLALPIEARLAALFLIGLALGGLVNWAIYSLAWNRRAISPWSQSHPKAPPRCRGDRLPIIGWFGLRREAKLHGPGFWIRPIVIELAMGFGLAALYWWEMGGGLLSARVQPALLDPHHLAVMLHSQFLAHAILFVLLMAATFIDFDEKTIPDAITVPGVLVGLLLVTIWPTALLPVAKPTAGVLVPGSLWLTSSATDWPPSLDSVRGLLIGLGGYLGWCLAVTPATITSRRGLAKGVSFFFVSIGRAGTWRQLAVLAAIGLVAIPLVWWLGGDHWRGMLTSLVGIALGGGLVWAIRIVASLALRKEALGFGDVTFMAMIGAFLGWQASWLIFFLSPVAAVVVSLVNLVLTGRRDLPFGPYLALAAAVVVVRWAWLWQHYGEPIFSLGWLLLAILGACLMLLMGLLMLWRMVEELLMGKKE